MILMCLLFNIIYVSSLSPEEFKRFHEERRNSIYENSLITTFPTSHFMLSPPNDGFHLITKEFTTQPHFEDFQSNTKGRILSKHINSNQIITKSNIYGWKNRDENYYKIRRGNKWKNAQRASNRMSKKIKYHLDAEPSYTSNRKTSINSMHVNQPIIFRKKLTASLNIQESPERQTTGKVYKLPITNKPNKPAFSSSNITSNETSISLQTQPLNSTLSPIPAITSFYSDNMVLPLPPQEVLTKYTTVSTNYNENNILKMFGLDNLLRLLNIRSESSVELVKGCSTKSAINRTVWLSPTDSGSEKAVVTTGGSCTVTIEKMSSADICHLRLDLNIFLLEPPSSGSCNKDRLIVSGHNINSYVPQICGTNSNRHMYIDVDTVSGPIELTVITIGSSITRRWEILVSQIECSNILRPPANCLQYYTGTQGFVSSFNYLIESPTTYLNNMNYAACLRKESGFCSVIYNNLPTKADSIPLTNTFDIVNFNIDNNGNKISVLPSGEAGVGLTQCTGDYLLLAGTRLCGERLNDASVDSRVTNDAPVTDSTNGPFIIQFKTNGDDVGKGFNLFYQQYPC